MKTTKLYAVIENGKEIYKGSAIEVRAFLNLPSKDLVYAYARDKYKLYGLYEFIPAGVRKTKSKTELKKEKKAEPKLTKHQEKLNYLAWHLNVYGNTIIKGDPKPYTRELKKQGIDVSIRPSGRKDYILERV